MSERRVVALICPKHGFTTGALCPRCEATQDSATVHINTYEWVKKGEWEHIDPHIPHMNLSSKEELFRVCESRGLLPKAFMKPTSRGKGFEISRRGYS